MSMVQPYSLRIYKKTANEEMISFRTGCFCNPGIDELNHCLSADELKSYFVGREHGDYFDFIKYIGKCGERFEFPSEFRPHELI